MAKIGFKVHPHLRRHAAGFVLANKGHDTRTLQAYLGHRSIQSTVRYTELAPGRFPTLYRSELEDFVEPARLLIAASHARIEL